MHKFQLSQRTSGIAMIIAGSISWGISSPMVQWLITERQLTVQWLLPLRTIPAGLCILLLLAARGHNIWNIWTHHKQWLPLMVFGIVGVLGLQVTFMNVIATGNAITATLFQFLGPIMIALYMAVQRKKPPASYEWMGIGIALGGIYFVVTNGSFSQLSLSVECISWGVATAIAFAFFTLYPADLLDRWGAALISGWSMIIGGLFFAVFSPSYHFSQFSISELDAFSLLLIVFVIFFGTILAFFLYAAGLQYLNPTESSILSSTEPLAAAITSVLWLSEPFSVIQMFGGFCIALSAVILSMKSGRIEGSNVIIEQ